MIIGITGQIGSGKSTAATIMASLGYRVIDADQIGRQVVDGSLALRRQLASQFGKAILTKKGNVRRKELARRAFVDGDSQAALNRIVHPYLLRSIRREMAACRRSKTNAVVDAALLLDWDLDREVDFTLVIHAGLKRRLERLVAKGYTLADARARQRRQLFYAEYCRRADRVILNYGTVSDLRQKIEAWTRAILSATGQHPR